MMLLMSFLSKTISFYTTLQIVLEPCDVDKESQVVELARLVINSTGNSNINNSNNNNNTNNTNNNNINNINNINSIIIPITSKILLPLYPGTLVYILYIVRRTDLS